MLEARGITKSYAARGGIFRRARLRDTAGQARGSVRALEDVSLTVEPGRTLGVVGESGSGKSTLARILTLLERPDSGAVWFEGTEARRLPRAGLERFRRTVQIIFQDPLGSLDPRMRVRDILAEPFLVRRPRVIPGDADLDRLLDKVGLPPAMKRRYPAELSGGERQRVSIARAIAPGPRILVCDEAVSSLDVLIQAQILNLFLRLQREEGLGYVFISHDLRIVRHMSDDVAVLESGRMVESGPVENVLSRPAHPYTARLLKDSDLSDLSLSE